MTSRSLRHLLEGGAPVPPPAPAPAILSEISWEVYVDAALEGAPPTALAEQAQNTGISDGAPLLTLTDWSPNARHLSRADTNGASFSESGLAGGPGINFASSATANKGYAPLTPILLTDNAVATFVLASKDLGSGADGYFFSIARAPSSNGPVCLRNGTDTLQAYTDTFAANGVTDKWFYSDLEMRPRLYFVEIDRSTITTKIRIWQNGVLKSETISGARAGGAPSLPHLFAALNGATPLIDEIVAFAGFVDGALTQPQRDVIASYFSELTGEPAWTSDWSYTQAEPWLATLINLKWEANPLLAPAAWRTRAQNTGISDLDTLPGLTEWSTGNHMVSPLDTQRLTYQATGLNGYPTGNADGVDDEVESTTAITLPVDAQMIAVASPSAAVRVLAEHGPNATSGANGMALLSIPDSSAEYAGQERRAGAFYRNRGPYANGAPHVISWEGNANSAGVYFRVDKLSATSSTSNSGTPSGDYTEKLHLGARSGGLFPMSGQVSFFAVVKNNRAAARVIEHQAALDYGVI